MLVAICGKGGRQASLLCCPAGDGRSIIGKGRVMSRTSALYELQQVDSGLDSRVARMRQIDERMGDSEELISARGQYEEIAERLAQEQAKLKTLSHDFPRKRGRACECLTARCTMGR